MTSPPYTAASFDPAMLCGYDFLYFRLHGLPQIPRAMYGDQIEGARVPALYIEQLTGVNLSGATVLVANCFGATSPFVGAFYRAGAGAVIAGAGPNLAAAERVIGTDKLAASLLRYLAAGEAAKTALTRAKLWLLPTIFRAADRDALAFKLMEGNYA
jgi:hypothetical protein